MSPERLCEKIRAYLFRRRPTGGPTLLDIPKSLSFCRPGFFPSITLPFLPIVASERFGNSFLFLPLGAELTTSSSSSTLASSSEEERGGSTPGLFLGFEVGSDKGLGQRDKALSLTGLKAAQGQLFARLPQGKITYQTLNARPSSSCPTQRKGLRSPSRQLSSPLTM